MLAAENLLVFKVFFAREKDWRDIDELVFALGEELDAAYAREWLERIVGKHERWQRADEALERQT